MSDRDLKKRVINATKWSTITQIAAKLVSPITNMILARILAPEAFGVIATVTMIVSFAEMFTDSGFQKYLVQHNFKDEKELFDKANVAFWTNFGISLFLWLLILIFRNKIASLVGSPGLGNVIVIASIQLFLTSFSSIQMALYRRKFNFKTLFIVRIIAVFIPFVVTIPLALLGFSYWSLIIGSIAIQLANAILLTIKSKWKPKFFYKIYILKEMLAFSIWSLIEAISIWLTSWIDTFIIGSVLNDYYLGLYKTSITMVNTIMALITTSVIPVLFATLSRYQDNKNFFVKVYFKFQRLVALFVFPLGVGIFLYSDLATAVLLGNKWKEASNIIGVWALTSSIMIVFGYFCSEVYRSKGKPKLSFFAQTLHLLFLVPTCIISLEHGFWTLVYSRALIRLQFVLVHLLIMNIIIKIKIIPTLKNVIPFIISTVLMWFLGYNLVKISNNVFFSIFSIILCVIFYFSILFILFPKVRKEIFNLIKNLI